MRFLSFLVAAWCVLSPHARALGDDRPRLVIHVVDCANVPSWTMSIAERSVTGALGMAGVNVQWRQSSSPPTVTGPGHVTVIILSREMAQRKSMTDAVPANALASAAPAADRAWVFFGRVIDAAGWQGSTAGSVLGLVIAHEVAHLVADMSHASEGIMSPSLPRIEKPTRGFSGAQHARMRASLSR